MYGCVGVRERHIGYKKEGQIKGNVCQVLVGVLARVSTFPGIALNAWRGPPRTDSPGTAFKGVGSIPWSGQTCQQELSSRRLSHPML